MSTKTRIYKNIDELKTHNETNKILLCELNIKDELIQIFEKNNIKTLNDLYSSDKTILENKKLTSLDRALKRLLNCINNNYSVLEIFNNKNLISYIRNNARNISKEYDEESYDFITTHVNKTSSIKKQNRPKFNKYNLSIIAHGRETAKLFTSDDFFRIYNPKEAKNIESSKYFVKLKNENIMLHCSSFNEKVLINNLQYHNSFRYLRTQFPKISNGKRGYHPDIFLLTNDGYIVVIEAKQQFDMNSLNSIKQYKLLKDYCTSKGYLYLMCDKWLKDYESLANIKISNRIKNKIEKAIKKNGAFVYDDYIKLMPLDKKDRNKKRKIDNQIARYVSQKNLKQTGRWSKKMKISING